jgi:hypothetical protein
MCLDGAELSQSQMRDTHQEGLSMSKRGRKRSARRKKNANHGKRPNS